MADSPEKLMLAAVYDWERDSPGRIYMTQPVGGGAVIDYSWGETLDQARRMAAHLRSLDLPPCSNIAIISKNCAHFIIAELAIWMAGHATVALYPTLNADTVAYILDHAEAKLLYLSRNYGAEVRDRPHPRSLDAISAMGEFWGSHVGFSSAEAFVVERERW